MILIIPALPRRPAEDGFLVLDRNSNNQIDGGNELFGTETTLATGQKAANGFEALKEFDQNGDGNIDSADDVYRNLKVWQDKNSNGIAEKGELFTLAELSVASIGVNYKNQKITDSNGTLHLQRGLFIRDDGSSGLTNTLFFENDRRDSVAVDNSIVVRDEIKALPNAKGYGNLHDLHQAMALDESGYLRSLVEAFAQEKDADRRISLTHQILIYWAGQQDTDPVGRGNYINGQHLGILETVWGQAVSQQKPTQAYAKLLNEIYTGLELSLYAQLRAGSDTLTKNLLNISIVGQENNTLLTDFATSRYYFIGMFRSDSAQAAIEFQDFTQVLNGLSAWDGKILAQFMTSIEEATAGDEALLYTIMNSLHSEAEVFTGTDADDVFRGYNGDDELYGNGGNDVLEGGDGNDVLDGGSGNDVLGGGSGNDTLKCGNGNDILHGGTGNDALRGGDGSDTYMFNLGDGQDVITEGSSKSGDIDTLRLGEGLNPQDVVLKRHFYANDSLVITFRDNSTDSITLYHYFGSEKYQIEHITFDKRYENLVLEKQQQELKALIAQYTLKAPVSGVVDALVFRDGGAAVDAPQELLRIVPENEVLRAEVMVSNSDVGFLHPGQAVTVKIDTFDFTRYGWVSGRLSQVSADATEDKDLGLVYRATIELERKALVIDGRSISLEPGMQVSAEIKTGKRTLLSYLLSPMMEALDDVGKQR